MSVSLSLKARLAGLALIASLGAVALAGFGAVLARANSNALERVYEDNVKGLVQLQSIDSDLREVRFRVAGVLLDLMPVPGARNHLAESRVDIARRWAEFQADGRMAAAGEQADLAAAMAAGFGRVDQVLARIEQGYAAKDTARLTEVLESDWAALHKDFVKPLQQLIPIKEASVKATYEAATARNRQLVLLGLAAALSVVGVTVVGSVLVTRRIGRSLDALAIDVGRIARGDLTRDVDVRGTDEIARVTSAVAAMQDGLRDLVGRVRASVDRVGTASTEIASSHGDLAHRTGRQAGSLQQTAAAMEQVTGTLSQSVDHAARATGLAASASEVAAHGGVKMQDVRRRMDDISTASRRIADITATIDGIAFQTNILALNAAVEAARAGDHGRGFAVVAGEVRQLAQSSAQAAREIKGLISSSVEKVQAGSALVDDAGRTMDDIVSRVRTVSDLIGEISAASREQSAGIGQVGLAIQDLDRNTQQTAAMTEQGAAAAESLRQEAQRLADSVATFRLPA